MADTLKKKSLKVNRDKSAGNNTPGIVLGIFVIIMVGLLLALFLFQSTSPLYPQNYLGDSANNLVYGNSMLHGIFPYKDIFATDGPLFYLLQVLICLVGDGRTGAFVLEVLLFVGSSVFVFLLFMKQFHLWCAVLFSVLYQIIYASLVGIGNTVEEYACVFVLICCSLALRKKIFVWKHSMLVGVCVSLVALISISYTIPALCISVAILFLKPLKGKRYVHIISGLLGALIPAAIVYTIYAGLGVRHGYKTQYLLYSLKKMALTFSEQTVWLHKGIKLLPLIALLFLLILVLFKEKNRESVYVQTKASNKVPSSDRIITNTKLQNMDRRMGVVILGSLLLCGLLGNEAWHRFLFLTIVFVWAMGFLHTLSRTCYRKIGKVAFCLLFCAIQAFALKGEAGELICAMNQEYRELNASADAMAEMLSPVKNQADNYLLYDLGGRIYLETDVLPTYKYLTNIEELIQVYPEIEDEIVDYIQAYHIPVLCVNMSTLVKNEKLGTLLAEKYGYYEGGTIEENQYCYMFVLQ